MGNLSLKHNACILISLSLVLMFSAAEQKYFYHDWRNVTWDQASRHCQVCFKELVTLTPKNIQTVSQTLTSDCWIGLRKYSGNSTKPWSRWADGEPLIFQNWYPGWPVSKSSMPERYCCTCPANTPTTSTPMMSERAECVRLPDVPNEDYIQDSCVAMLSFGPWVEKNCSERLPFICYEDHFSGQVTVTEKTNESAVITWPSGPGNISHYRIEVRSDGELIQNQTQQLTLNLVNLTGGKHYSVQVFPVKCNRDLNPQQATFSTTPNKVENLTIATVTQTSVFLRWNKPAGRVDFYCIKVQGDKWKQSDIEHTQHTHTEVGSLIPGNSYTFTVLSGVGNSSLWSKESSITAYTKPGTVSDLRVTNSTKNWLQLKWVQPEGTTTGYLVKASNENNILFDERVIGTEVRITELPEGAKITLSVTALTANGTLEGDKVSNISYTAPGPISNLTLRSTFDSITATWASSASNSSRFTIKLQLKGKNVSTVDNLKEPRKHFDKLKTGAKYTVIVYTVNGHLEGIPVQGSIFTVLSAPVNASVLSFDKNQITFQWTPPDNLETAKYFVNISSSFWGHSWSHFVEKETNYTFDGLTSGTRYDFEVRVTVNGKFSDPAAVSHFTEADKREISLSMLCSSAQSLLCDDNTTRDDVIKQLHKHFKELLGNNIFWNLKKQETEN